MLADELVDPGGLGTLASVTPDQELMVIFGALHFVALAFGGLLFVMFLRSETTEEWRPPDEDDGSDGGGNDRSPETPRSPGPSDGLPLPDAEPAPVRLRDHRKLRDVRPDRPARRPQHPARPRPRVPSR
jgi:hypothetical protein